MIIRECEPADFDDICSIINDAAVAYRGIIAADRWKDPYMPEKELRKEIDDGVVFWGAYDNEMLLGVMGLQHVQDVALIRHAYTRTSNQGSGIGSALLREVVAKTDRPVLIGTWTDAAWAIRFYEKHGFQLASRGEKKILLRRYWNIPDRQVEESVVLTQSHQP